jgi:DNA-binding transcriptional ArsR family regulator
VIGAHDRAANAYSKATAELASLGQVEPVASLEARLETAVPVDVWRRTAKCTDVSKAASREACEPAQRIREQIAKSRRIGELESKITEARKVLDGSAKPAAADPQIEVLSRATGWTEATLLLALTWLAGGAMELVSCFGMALLRSGRTEEEQDVEAGDVGLSPQQQALQWALGEISRSNGKLRVQNAAVAARFGVDPATVTRWRKQWREAGILDEYKDGNVIHLKVARGR